jgi:hypothetical protein
MLLAAVLMGLLAWRRFGSVEALIAAGGLIGLAGLIYLWWRRFDESRIRENYVQMMRVGYIMAGGFLGFLSCQLLRGL